MDQAQKTVGLEVYGKPISDYVELAEWPFIIAAGLIVLVYLISIWMEMSYYGLVVSLILLIQILIAAALAYWRGVLNHDTWPQIVSLAVLVGMLAGLISAVAALIRFGRLWMVFNLITEPIWSGLLAALISLLTLGFFALPAVLRPWAGKIKK
ncbi:MAG: hypothetical protein WC621_00795 [Patescibacteria group bacterium]